MLFPTPHLKTSELPKSTLVTLKRSLFAVEPVVIYESVYGPYPPPDASSLVTTTVGVPATVTASSYVI